MTEPKKSNFEVCREIFEVVYDGGGEVWNEEENAYYAHRLLTNGLILDRKKNSYWKYWQLSWCYATGRLP